MFEVLAATVVAAHFGFLVFGIFGGWLARRHRLLLFGHLLTIAWSVGLITLRYDCPLTPLEKWLRRRADGRAYEGGFIDHYIEGVIYPERLTPIVQAAIGATVALSYLWARHRRRGDDAGHVRHDA